MSVQKDSLISFLFYGIVIVGFSSCIGSKKINQLNSRIEQKNSALQQLISKLDSMQVQLATKINAGETDSITSRKVTIFLDSVKKEAAAEVKNNSQTPFTKLSRTDYKIINGQIIVANQKIGKQIEDVDLINDLMHQATMEKFKTAAFFDVGKYELPANMVTSAKKAFTPVFDKMMSFAAKYPRKQLQATMVVLGFADEQGYAEDSPLYKDLASAIQSAEPTRQQLNIEISKRRATNISKVLKEMSDNMLVVQKFEIQFIAQGRGEHRPNPSITNYTADDERRRVVIIYWGVFPK
jgi:outer membrane protein OmpA-like peptidoglycan-associated protein